MLHFVKVLMIALTIIMAMKNALALAATAEDGDIVAIKNCLRNWPKQPFGKEMPEYRVLATKVKVLGIGGEVKDSVVTEKPELILIKPNVTVLSKAEMSLLNPQGWYCLKGAVSVLGKSVIHLQCKANLTSSKDGATVMSGGDSTEGVTVLGSSSIDRVGCN